MKTMAQRTPVPTEKQVETSFTEKLRKLTEGRNKSALSLKAGMPPTAISNYISKGQLPRLDYGVALARVLGVSLEWLADDEQGMPPVKAAVTEPTGSDLLPATLPTDDDAHRRDIATAAGRMSGEPLRVLKAVAESLFWHEVVKRMMTVERLTLSLKGMNPEELRTIKTTAETLLEGRS